MAFDASALRGDGPWRIPETLDFRSRVRVLMDLARRAERDPDVRAWARAVARRAAELGDPRFARRDARLASAALAAVQLLPYRDERAGEQYQSVRRTLRTSGNCHDLAPLLVATLHLLGIPARIFWIRQRGEAKDHVTVEAYVDGAWCLAEPTIRGAALCENPYAAAARLGHHARLGMASTVTARGVLSGQLTPFRAVVTADDVRAVPHDPAAPALVAGESPAVATNRQLVPGAPPQREPAPRRGRDLRPGVYRRIIGHPC